MKNGDPSQISLGVERAIERVGALNLTIEITPRTPDCSPIENVPNHIDRQLKEDPFALKITHKSHNNFLGRLHKSMYKQLSRQPADN